MYAVIIAFSSVSAALCCCADEIFASRAARDVAKREFGIRRVVIRQQRTLERALQLEDLRDDRLPLGVLARRRHLCLGEFQNFISLCHVAPVASSSAPMQSPAAQNHTPGARSTPCGSTTTADTPSRNITPADTLGYPLKFELALRYGEGPLLASTSVTDSEKLLLEALARQSRHGPCREPRPSMFDSVAKARWSAWMELGQRSKMEAMFLYTQARADTLGRRTVDRRRHAPS